MQPDDHDQDPFTDLGAEDRIRKPERKNAKQWLTIALGMVVMTLGGLWFVVALIVRVGAATHRVAFSLPGVGIMAAGYAIYQSSWNYRSRK